MRVLLITEDPEKAIILTQGLRAAGYFVVANLPDTQHLLLQMRKSKAEIAVIEISSLKAETIEHLISLNKNQPCPTVVFTQQQDSLMSHAAVKAGVSAYIVDGLSYERIKPIMNIAITRFHEMQRLYQAVEKAALSLNERKHIERAKGILMKRAKVEEHTAYQTLRKMAMNRNKRIIEVAQSIISAEQLIAHQFVS